MTTIRKSLADMAASLVGLGRTRFELLALEISVETGRLLKVLGCVFGAVLCLALALLAFSILIGVYFWPTDCRYLALAAVAAFYAVVGIFLFYLLRRYLMKSPPPFAATLEELGRDLQMLDRVRTVLQEEEQAAQQAETKRYRGKP
jgi:uncharacterized membrane protein YqjE